ncbi:MAG TPA: hypothetical protein VFL47_12530, partial [Flavisolibacter sp.]|nr:hypothetical protein [Flavisolibacter sp.]
ERFETSVRTVVLDLDAAEKIIERIVGLECNVSVRCGKRERFVVIRSGNITLYAEIAVKVVNARAFPTVKCGSVIEEIAERISRIDTVVYLSIGISDVKLALFVIGALRECNRTQACRKASRQNEFFHYSFTPCL